MERTPASQRTKVITFCILAFVCFDKTTYKRTRWRWVRTLTTNSTTETENPFGVCVCGCALCCVVGLIAVYVGNWGCVNAEMFEARDKFLNCVRLCCSEKNYTPEAAIMIMCCAKRTLPALDPVYYNSQGFFFSFLLNCWIEQSFHPLSICSIWTSEMRNNVRRSNWHQKLHFHILRGSFPIARFNFTSGFMRNGCRRVADAIIAQSQSLKRI